MAPPGPGGTPAPPESPDLTPPRVSYINGDVSFWRPGAQDWTPAAPNTPLAPGDALYASEGGTVEIQIGPRAFVRGTYGTQITLDNQDADFIQLRMTGGQAALDLRQLRTGATVELDTPNAAFTVDRSGYYRVDVDQDSTAFASYRAGGATMTPAGGAATPVLANQQIVVTGTETPNLAVGAVPELSAWDRWNAQRTSYMIQSAGASYVPQGVYGTQELAQYGSWRPAETYGSVWVPAGLPAGWVPYSTGRWIWDPRFGWTWLDNAPWGWAPYHYGRWVQLGSAWGWAPGPVVVRPAYAPALVVFLGGPTVSVAVGRPLYWAALGWGEPVIPWWGRPGFVGVPWWGGWGGPRVVNNVVINRTTTVNVTNINVYRNVNVNGAVVGVPADRFGRGQVQVTRVSATEVGRLTPVRGPLEVRPVAASMAPLGGPATKPPAAMHERAVVATRPPEDLRPALQAHGLAVSPASTAPRIVPPPRQTATVPVSNLATGTGAGKAPGTTPERPGTARQRPGRGTSGPPEGSAPPPPGQPKASGPARPNATGPGGIARGEQHADPSTPPPPPPRQRTRPVPPHPAGHPEHPANAEHPPPPR